jgi:hypothetical protein
MPKVGEAEADSLVFFDEQLLYVERPNGIENLSISLVSRDVRGREFHCFRKWAQYNAIFASLEGNSRGDLE